LTTTTTSDPLRRNTQWAGHSSPDHSDVTTLPRPGRRTRTIGVPLLLFVATCLLGLYTPVAYGQSNSQPPTILQQTPSAGAIGQMVTSHVTVTFSEAIQSSSVFFVLSDSSNTPVPANVSYNASTNTITLSPSTDLTPSRTYTATLSGAKGLADNLMAGSSVWSFSTGQPGFQESVVLQGLVNPTAFEFAPDGRIFVAQKDGVILVYQSLNDTNPTVFADLRTNVHNFANRGLLGMALAPNFPATPYIYVFYAYDAPIGGTAPTWGSAGGSNDICPQPNGACVVSGRISRLEASGNIMTGTEQVLVEDWYQQYATQSVGNLAFGPDGALYAAAGDGASSTIVDYGQTDPGSPDPPNEGGALRSQDLVTPGDPVTLDGSVIRIDAGTGQPVRRNTSMTVSGPTVDANNVKSYIVTSVYQGSQPMTVRVLEPTNPAPGKPRRLLYVLPVQAGVTDLSSTWSDGLEELRLLDVQDRFNMTLIAPSFSYEPWYGDNVLDPSERMESFIINDLVPWGDMFVQGADLPQRFLIGFSKSGNGALFLILRHPDVFSEAAAWDSPAQLSDLSTYSALPVNFGTQENFNLYNIPSLVTSNAQAFTQQNRLWISGDQAAWTADMDQLHDQLTAAGIPHTWVAGGVRVHSWSSGWLDGAVTALDANATVTAPVNTNGQRIIAFGLRSPRLTFRPGTPEIWISDRGWNTAEEINRIPDGTSSVVENFGWPCYEGAATTAYSGLGICNTIYSQPVPTAPPYYSYDHHQKVVAGDEGGVGSGSISGLAFYSSGNYPDQYQGSLFFADSVRNQIWVMFKGDDGLPNSGNISNFLLGASSPFDLKTGPDGDLFYADFSGGTIRRISYANPPSLSNAQPSGVLAAGTTQTTISLATDQAATCRYATTPGVPFTSMQNVFAITGGTLHSTLVTGLIGGTDYDFYVRCEDVRGNTNSDDFTIAFSVAKAGDTTPPVRTNGAPNGVLAAGTVQASLSLTTDESATCRYATVAGTVYSAMTNVFSSTGGTAQTTALTGLANGTSYRYYVRCQDASGNANPDDYAIVFSVAAGNGQTTVTSSFAGVEDPLSENRMWDTPGSWTSLKKNNGAYSTDLRSAARLVAPAIGADQYAEITYDQDPGASAWPGVMTRIQGPANGSGYLAIAYAGQVRLYEADDTGSLNFSLLASANVDLGAAPRDLRMESQGATQRVYFNGVLEITYTSSVYTTGQPGIAASIFGGPTVRILSFVGGSMSSN
jgi:glucose/arabinose dehydrogenase/S-formylglutathione hydrolase FrmB